MARSDLGELSIDEPELQTGVTVLRHTLVIERTPSGIPLVRREVIRTIDEERPILYRVPVAQVARDRLLPAHVKMKPHWVEFQGQRLWVPGNPDAVHSPRDSAALCCWHQQMCWQFTEGGDFRRALGHGLAALVHRNQGRPPRRREQERLAAEIHRLLWASSYEVAEAVIQPFILPESLASRWKMNHVPREQLRFRGISAPIDQELRHPYACPAHASVRHRRRS